MAERIPLVIPQHLVDALSEHDQEIVKGQVSRGEVLIQKPMPPAPAHFNCPLTHRQELQRMSRRNKRGR